MNVNGTATDFFKIGAYWDGTEQDNTFIWLDEVVISDTYNGPLGGASGSSLTIPSGVTISG
jgi:hypothetical protein